MNVTIDKNSGYCFGVEFAIQMAEDEMEHCEELYCLGDIVHNSMEVKRLYNKGLRIIDRDQLKELRDCKVLIRAHGEPPETYKLALENNIELIDASCPVVLKLQNRVKHAFDSGKAGDAQVVIYGQVGHAEVIGLTGQTGDEAIITSIIVLAQSLGFKTLAEGVETEVQLAWLEQRGCDEVQGFLFSKAVDAEAFAGLLRANGAAPAR